MSESAWPRTCCTAAVALLSAPARSFAADTVVRARRSFCGACANCWSAEANFVTCAAGEASSSGSPLVSLSAFNASRMAFCAEASVLVESILSNRD